MTTIDKFWTKFCSARDTFGPTPETVVFGASSETQEELCTLVLRRRKNATAFLARWVGEGREPLPKPGDLWIMLDGGGNPRGIIETTEIKQGAFSSVDAKFAADEGEGDGSLEYWIAEHERYFANELAKEGLIFTETEQVFFERFRLVWPETELN